MAGDWIKWTHGFARKPEVMQIAVRLGRPRHEVAGILMELYEWADVNVVIDTGASGFDPDNCPGIVRLGEETKQLLDLVAGVAGLADAMIAVGWLKVESGLLEFPKFGRHNGKTAKARGLDSARKRAERSTLAQPFSGVPKVSGFDPDQSRTREEKRREEDEKTPLPPAKAGGATDTPPTGSLIPAELDTEEFRAAWGEWKAERVARRIRPYTRRGEQDQFKKLASFGPAVAVAAIRESIAQGWQGLFPERVKRPVAAATPPAETRLDKLRCRYGTNNPSDQLCMTTQSPPLTGSLSGSPTTAPATAPPTT